MRKYADYQEPNGFVHSQYTEWVGYPMQACTCGHPWPCETVRAADEETP